MLWARIVAKSWRMMKPSFAHLCTLLAIPSIFALTCCATTTPSELQTQGNAPATTGKGKLEAATLDSGGRKRTYLFQLPSDYSSSKRWPVVLAISGNTQSGHDAARISRFDEFAYRNGVIAVFPNSAAGWDLQGDSDVEFFSAIINKLVADDSADASRVYVTGGASGGLLVFKLACELADRIAAVAPVVATMPVTLSEDCHPARPISVLEINGTADRDVRYEGGVKLGLFGNFGLSLLSAPASAHWWAQTDGCADTPVRDSLPPKRQDGLETLRDTYHGCREGTAVALYSVVGGGHTWPGGQGLPRLIFGKTSRDLNANEVIWQFFEAHPFPTPAN
jgi:polyhydroxybutyrate depolymerase